MINLELIRNAIKDSSTYGMLISGIGAAGIFLYTMYNPSETIREKEDGNNFVTIQLSAFAPPSKDPIADKVQKPKHKPKHKKHKKHREMVEAPPKPIPTPLQVMEKPQEEVNEQTNDFVEVEKAKEDIPVADIATTVQSNPDSNADQNIKTLRFSDGIDNAFLRAIRLAVQKRHQYPNLAQQRGFEGEVLVRFLITATGQVSKIQIIRACPHPILNKAALKTVQKASKDFPKPNESTYIEIPVAYTLKQ